MKGINQEIFEIYYQNFKKMIKNDKKRYKNKLVYTDTLTSVLLPSGISSVLTENSPIQLRAFGNIFFPKYLFLIFSLIL